VVKTEHVIVDGDGREARRSVRQLRLVVEAEDFDDAVRFYRDVLGLPLVREAVIAEQGVKAGLLINAARTALTGQAVGPSMFEVFDAVGRERSARRLREATRLV
jgi:glutamyl-tRNA synthetase